MFSIDAKSDKDYYIILKDGKEFVKVKKTNPLAAVKKYFGIELLEGGGAANATNN